MSIVRIQRQIAILIVVLSYAVLVSADQTVTYVDVAQWAVKRISSWSPPGQSYMKDAAESTDEANLRYRSIADDALEIAFDPKEAPLFSGPIGRSKTAALLLSIANSESGFRKDVDTGIGERSRGDGGTSWCLMQIKLGALSKGKTVKRIKLTSDTFVYSNESTDIGGEDLVVNRKACFRVGLHIIRYSFKACSSLPEDERLSAYASGNCNNGKTASRYRVGMANNWVKKNAPLANDSEIMALIPVPEITGAAAPID